MYDADFLEIGIERTVIIIIINNNNVGQKPAQIIWELS
jgi:hypothetical protein